MYCCAITLAERSNFAGSNCRLADAGESGGGDAGVCAGVGGGAGASGRFGDLVGDSRAVEAMGGGGGGGGPVDRADAGQAGWIYQAGVCAARIEGSQEAWDTLHPVSERFNDNWLIPYNLACYAAQMGREADAVKWYRKALRVGDERELQEMALSDPDLQPIRPKIEKMIGK